MFTIGVDARIDKGAVINVDEGFIGNRAIINKGAIIEGHHVEIGHEAFINDYAHIGGGSCFDPQSKVVIGDFLHMGRFSHINGALPITIGHEFGCGMGTTVVTHGAYQSAYDGFPVQWAESRIGDNVWMPNAWVNPGVTVGNNVVVAAMSLVNKDLPDGCLAGGIPARILRENVYPRELEPMEKHVLLQAIMCRALEIDAQVTGEPHQVYVGIIDTDDTFGVTLDDTLFDIDNREIFGAHNRSTEIVKNQLRRNGIRFRYYADKETGEYQAWKHQEP